MSSEEDENYVTVTVKARGREHSLYCRTAVVVTARADNIPGPACHIGDLDELPVLADRAVSELLGFDIGAGVPEDRMRIELVHAATSCGYTEEEERDAIRYNLDIDADESAKEEKDE